MCMFVSDELRTEAILLCMGACGEVSDVLVCSDRSVGGVYLWPCRGQWGQCGRALRKKDFRNLGMACSVSGLCRRSFCLCACDAIELLP